MAQLMPLPLPLTVSCFSKIQIGFTFLVPAHPGSPGQGPLNVCSYSYMCVGGQAMGLRCRGGGHTGSARRARRRTNTERTFQFRPIGADRQ